MAQLQILELPWGRYLRAKMEKITLTPSELQELKDEITFRVNTTIALKSLEREIKKLNGINEKVKSLEKTDKIQWSIILALLAGITGLALL